MSIRFGVSPIAWSNDDLPSLGGDTPLETCLRDAQETGFEGVELGGKFPRNPTELAPLLDRFNLDLVGGWYSGSLLTLDADAEIGRLQDHLALLRAMGSRVFIFAECSNTVHSDMNRPLSTKPRLSDNAWRRFGERITAVADYITSEGLRFAYHHHAGSVVESATDLARFLAETGANAGLVLDTGHAHFGGIDSAQIIRAHPRRIAHVHCKDVRQSVLTDIRARDASFLNGVLEGMFTVPGDGALSFAPIMSALADTGYSGWIIVEAEQDPETADPRIYSQLGLQSLKQSAAQAGLLERSA